MAGVFAAQNEGQENVGVRLEPERWLNSDALTSESKIQFRVDNVSRFIKNERENQFRSSTVFCDGMAYDFVGDNGEIVVYSFALRKFALIDPIRRICTEIDEAEIDRFLERIKSIIREKRDGFASFMTQPEFEISEKNDETFFQSKWIDYHITSKPFDDEQVADLYFRFCDAMGKLNVYMNPGVVTPLARIEANRRFAERSLFPERVSADIYPKGKTIFTKTVQIDSVASLSRRLSERDRNRINRAIQFGAQFTVVSFKTYIEKTNQR